MAGTLAVSLECFASPVAFLLFFDHVLVVLVIVTAMMMVYIDVFAALLLFVRMLQLRLPSGFDDAAC